MTPSREKHDRVRGNKGAILFMTAVFTAFLAILLLRRQLVFMSFHSLATALQLVLESPEKLQEIFTPDILEFWIGVLYLVLVPFVLFFLALRIIKKRKSEKGQQQMEELSLGKISLKAFKRNPIAMYASSIIFILYSAAFLAPFIAPFNPFDQQDFLVTAYQPPLTRIEALVLKEPKNLPIPLQSGDSREIRLANSLIGDFQALKTRNELHAVRFVNEYHIEGGNVIYRQGIRNREIPLSSLLDPETATQARPTFVHPRMFVLGTDQYGRDILSRVIYGSRISLSIGFLVVLISVTLGTIIGVTSGYFGGWVDAITMRIVDVLIAFPALFLILIIIATFGNSIYLIVTTLSFTGWMGVSRIVRSQVLSLKEQEFILAARSLGLSNMRIIFRHLVPNTLTPVIIAATLRIGSIILTEAGLSFLGLGVQPPVPSWGNIINEGRDSLLNYWWISTFPGIAILTTVVCFNLIGDGVRDALDPRMRG
ncbi:MAG: ABC transporter permease [Chlorobiaceae bacterium]|nr:ABC transporter permease [Chlorobiaceae bacterium]